MRTLFGFITALAFATPAFAECTAPFVSKAGHSMNFQDEVALQVEGGPPVCPAGYSNDGRRATLYCYNPFTDKVTAEDAVFADFTADGPKAVRFRGETFKRACN